MLRRKFILSALASLALVLPPMVGVSGLAQSANAQRPTASKSQAYKVYYYNKKYPSRVYVYGTYYNYANALRAMHYLNSYPEYRAYIRSR